MTGFDKLALAGVMLGALVGAASAPAVAEVRPVSGSPESTSTVLLFRVLMREYLEFRVGSQVTIRSNAGQVVITASDPRPRNEAIASTWTPIGQPFVNNRPAASPQPSGFKPLMPPAAVVTEASSHGATNVCLYLEGSTPSCGDLSEIAGQVIYTASNP